MVRRNTCSCNTCTKGNVFLVLGDNNTSWPIYVYSLYISLSLLLLGAETTRALIHKAGVGNGSIWMTAVRCSSTNTDITDCQFTSDTSRCNHNDDLAITCQDKSENQACFSNLII